MIRWNTLHGVVDEAHKRSIFGDPGYAGLRIRKGENLFRHPLCRIDLRDEQLVVARRAIDC